MLGRDRHAPGHPNPTYGRFGHLAMVNGYIAHFGLRIEADALRAEALERRIGRRLG